MRKLLLSFFIGIHLLSLTREFIFYYLGTSLSGLITQLTYGSMVILALLVFSYFKIENKFYIRKKYFIFTQILFAYYFILFIYGLIIGNPTNRNVADLFSFMVLTLFIYIGSIDAFWEDFFYIGLFYLIIAVGINIVSSTIINPEVIALGTFDVDPKERIAKALLSYDTQWALSFWVIYWLMLPTQTNKKYFILICFIVIIVFTQQIVFQKRAPVIRILIYILSLLFLLPKIYRTNYDVKMNISGIRKIFMTMLISIIFISVIIQPIRYFISNQFIALIERFDGNSYKEDLGIETNIVDNERMYEIKIMLNGFTFFNHLFGKGFGGAFLDESKYFAQYIPDYDGYYKEVVHMGLFMPYLKGGIIFCIVFYLFIFIIPIININITNLDYLTLVTYFILIISALFLFIEGSFLFTGNLFDLMLQGASIGRLHNYISKYYFNEMTLDKYLSIGSLKKI